MPILTIMGRALLVAGVVLTAPVSNSAGGPVSLSLNEPHLFQQLYQRDAQGGRNVQVSGTTSGTDAVQARAVDADSGAEVVTWTTIDQAPAGGAFSGVLRCPGRINPYLIEVRDAVNTISTAKMVKRFYVGAHWLWMGQSLAVNMWDTTYKYPLGGKGSLHLVGTAFQRIGPVNDNFPPSTRTGSGVGWGGAAAPRQSNDAANGDGYVYFANILSEKLGCAVCFSRSATGGKPISFWTSPSGGNTGWANALGVLAAIGGDAEGALWHHGQADAAAGASKAYYLGELAKLHAMYHTATGRTAANFKFGLVIAGATAADGSYVASMDQIRAALVEYANGTPGAFFAASDQDCQTPNDSVHAGGVSYSHLGPVLAHSTAAQYGVGPSGAGPRVVGAARAGPDIDFTVQQAGGTALLDGAGGTGTSLTGFRVWLTSDPNKTPLAIASTGITSANKFRVSLVSDPGGPVSADYAMIPAPHAPDLVNTRVTPNFASAIYDNVALLHQVRGCILQPFSAMAIAGS